MTESKHTPGPWRLFAQYLPETGRVEQGLMAPYIVDTTGRNVAAVCVGEPIPDAELFANLCLIASAPDLLAERDRLRATQADLIAALREIVEITTDEDIDLKDTCTLSRECARAALARVEGK